MIKEVKVKLRKKGGDCNLAINRKCPQSSVTQIFHNNQLDYHDDIPKNLQATTPTLQLGTCDVIVHQQ